MSDNPAVTVKTHQPGTFQERGLAVPFTTPLLCGARVRKSARGTSEFVLPNPSGAPGVYIMPWQSIGMLCRPTLHDRVLKERIDGLGTFTPAAIRVVAQQIAADGLAGEEAVTARHKAVEVESTDRLVTNYALLMNLTEQLAPALGPQYAAMGLNALHPEKRARLAVDWISPRLGRPPNWTARALEELTDVMRDSGVGQHRAKSRIPRLLALLQQTSREIMKWTSGQRAEIYSEAGQTICSVADLTAQLAEIALTSTRALTDDMANLLRSWSTDSRPITELAERCDWLLDGWDQLCLIWQHARDDDAGRRAAIAEIIALVPVPPKEVSTWSNRVSDAFDALRQRRQIPISADWRTGTASIALIARNEHFRAVTA